MKLNGSFATVLVDITLCFSLTLLSGTLWASGRTVYVPPPNGVDDTANLQSALDACVAQGPGCTVQLAAGTYHTRQLVEYNFQGTFKGMGVSNTTIEAIYPLLVEIEQNFGGPDGIACQPNTTTCLWPSLILFVDGDIHVSDLSLFENAPPGMATTPWNFAGLGPYTGLFDVLMFTGQHVNAYVDRIHMEGLPDPTNFSGFNVVNGVHFTGEFPRSLAPFDWYFLSGSYTVRNSFLKTMYDGISQDSFVKSTHITIGGSPTTGNHLEGMVAGIDMETLEGSVVEISYNESSGTFAGMWIVPWAGPFKAPSSPSRYLIHDNQFSTNGQFAACVFLFDNLTDPWIKAAIWDNAVEVQNSLSGGIVVENTQGTATWNNFIAGSDGLEAVGLYSSALDTVIANDVSGFTVDPTVGYAQIHLDPHTTNDLIVCAQRNNTVLNQGANNVVFGCQQLDAASKSVSPADSKPRLDLPKGKPWLRQP